MRMSRLQTAAICSHYKRNRSGNRYLSKILQKGLDPPKPGFITWSSLNTSPHSKSNKRVRAPAERRFSVLVVKVVITIVAQRGGMVLKLKELPHKWKSAKCTNWSSLIQTSRTWYTPQRFHFSNASSRRLEKTQNGVQASRIVANRSTAIFILTYRSETLIITFQWSQAPWVSKIHLVPLIQIPISISRANSFSSPI